MLESLKVMKKIGGYKIAVLVLSAIVVLETVLLAYFGLRRPKKMPPKVEIKGKIAIVIDDWGYNLNNLHFLEEIEYPITASILPHLGYSKSVALALKKHGAEIILHLPMEPHEKFRLEENTILTSMDEETIRDIIARDLEDIYYARGASNHMGSKATEDKRTMGIVFSELKKRGLFFLDSLVSPRSICLPLAQKVRLEFARRDVFLDNKEDAGYIRGQLEKLKTRAQAYGAAVGIGHDRRVTLEVLKEAMPELEKQGYKFVYLSELVK